MAENANPNPIREQFMAEGQEVIKSCPNYDSIRLTSLWK